jgi:hypothetical protein
LALCLGIQIVTGVTLAMDYGVAIKSHYMLETSKTLSTFKSDNLKDITMSNQQENLNNIVY